MTRYHSNEEIEKEFDETFHDITHVGCEGSLSCGTMKNDVKKWLIKTRLSDLDAIIEKIKTDLETSTKYPKGFQILCHNCNMAKSLLGKCPLMKLEAQVVSLELARKMRELSAPQESYFWWVSWNEELTDPELMYIDEIRENGGDIYKVASAYTVAELGEMLPEYHYSQKLHSDTKSNRWEADVPEGKLGDTDERFLSDTEADARAKMWIYLKENGLI